MIGAILDYLFCAAWLTIKAAAFTAAVITAGWILFEIWLQLVLHAIR